MSKKIILGKHFDFEASHQLPNEPCYGKCKNLHGHRYELVIEITGEITQEGWICDFAELKNVVHTQVIQKLDHQHLNQFFPIPTAEHIVSWIWEKIEESIAKFPYQLHKITLYETANSYVSIQR